ncbi:hypothetical protein TNCV_1905631 [Trichonephila clavipes]|nr:hypothetical protein TNCV_1905631 [Trichonephila clavipes]
MAASLDFVTPLVQTINNDPMVTCTGHFTAGGYIKFRDNRWVARHVLGLIPNDFQSHPEDKKACLSAVGVRAMTSMSSAKANNCIDLLKIFPLVLILESLTTFYNARLKRRNASASPCRTPFRISRGFERLFCTLTMIFVSLNVRLISLNNLSGILNSSMAAIRAFLLMWF